MQFSQRGVLNLAHDLGDVRSSMRRVEANRLNGGRRRVARRRGRSQAFVPDREHLARRAVPGARRRPCSDAAAVARHDKIAWGYATRASELGVDIVEHAEVTGFLRGAERRA